MTKREVTSRYKEPLLGLLWSFFNSLIMLTIYAFLLSVVFKLRWGGSKEENTLQFAFLMFVGINGYGLLADMINQSPGLIVDNAYYSNYLLK
jgi:lipopolysaccharide transport system permease protein